MESEDTPQFEESVEQVRQGRVNPRALRFGEEEEKELPHKARKMSVPVLGKMLELKAKVAADRKELREWRKLARPHRAKMLVTADGQVGYGAYRRRVRRRGYVRGRGGYFSDAMNWMRAKIPKGSGRALGRIVGGTFGSSTLGADIGSSISKWTGVGAYDGPDTMDQQVPQVINDRGTDGAVVINHREYICDVVSTGPGFHVAFSGPVQPGSASTFPWLSTVAANFTQYKIEGMVFHFVSTSGSLATTQALGEVILACNYNVTDPGFTNKAQMLNEVMAVSKVPSNDAACGVECERAQSPLGMQYIRGAFVPAGQDPRFYDLAQFTIATQGQSTGVTLGELWVTYQIALYKPQLPVLEPGGALNSQYYVCYNYSGAYTPGQDISTFATKTNVQGALVGNTQIFNPTTGTFNADFSGVMIVYWTGTALGAKDFTGGTVTYAGDLAASSGSVNGAWTVMIRATVGDTLRLKFAGTTVTACNLYMVPSVMANGLPSQ